MVALKYYAIEFALFAQRLRQVKLVGSFSQWKPIDMIKDDKTGVFKISVDLEDGDHFYKFLVSSLTPSLITKDNPEGWTWVADPYSVLFDKIHCNSIARVYNGKRITDTYQWKNDHIQLPKNNEMIIYEMFLLHWTKEGTFAAAEKKLDYLVDLGFNAIQLMPITERPWENDWGYITRNYMAIENTFGTSEDFKRFIDAAHGRGIRILIDGVFNHSGSDCPLFEIDREYWYYKDRHHPEDLLNAWGPEFNYSTFDDQLGIHPAWVYFTDVLCYYLIEYHIDGVRIDGMKQLDNFEVIAHFDIITKSIVAKQQNNKPFILIAESIPDDPCLTKPRGPFDIIWRQAFKTDLIPQLVIRKFFQMERFERAVDCRHQGYENGSRTVINYFVSHDEDRLRVMFEDCGLSSERAIRRCRIAYALLMTSVGIPQQYQGEEFLSPQKPLYDVWNLLETDEFHQTYFQFIKKLVHLRRTCKALQSDHCRFFHQEWERKVIAYERMTYDQDERVVVVLSLSDKDHDEHRIQNFPMGHWREVLYGEDIHAPNDGSFTLSLKSDDVKIFVSKTTDMQ